MKYFGTDGIRGVVSIDLNTRLIKKIAKALVIFYKRHKFKKVLLVGNDTRASSDYILANFSSILLEYGIEIHNVGELTSPCIAYIAKKFHYPMAMMISASHNSCEYNGIKFFNNAGEKISTLFEQELENYVDKKIYLKKTYSNIINVEHLKENYINYLQKLKQSKNTAIFDCASGATSYFIKKLFPKSKKIHANPNGHNINLNSGCTHIENLSLLCRKEKSIGFAFDGDGDRVIMVDEVGNIIDGDKMLYILSKFYLNKCDNLVGTIYTNEGLNLSLKKYNVNLLRAPVGDKNVYEKMLLTGTNLGGENSGHIILKHYTNTGDGILNAIIIMNILSTTHFTINELLNDYCEYHQSQDKVKLNNIINIDYENIIEKFKTDDTRIIVRPSGTEPIIRIMVESKNQTLSKNLCQKIKKYIENFIKN